MRDLKEQRFNPRTSVQEYIHVLHPFTDTTYSVCKGSILQNLGLQCQHFLVIETSLSVT